MKHSLTHDVPEQLTRNSTFFTKQTRSDDYYKKLSSTYTIYVLKVVHTKSVVQMGTFYIFDIVKNMRTAELESEWVS